MTTAWGDKDDRIRYLYSDKINLVQNFIFDQISSKINIALMGPSIEALANLRELPSKGNNFYFLLLKSKYLHKR